MSEVPGNRALLLLDLQNDFLAPTGRCRVRSLEFLESIKTLLEGIRKEDGEVYWLRSEYAKQRNAQAEGIVLGHRDPYYVPEAGESIAGEAVDEEEEDEEKTGNKKQDLKTDAFLSVPEAQCCKKGTLGAEFFEDVQGWRKKTDHIRVKSFYSAFEETTLIQELRSRFVTQIYVAGVMSNTSVYATVASAASHGLKVFLPPDCLGYRSLVLHNKVLNIMTGEFCAETMTVGFLAKMWETRRKNAGPQGSSAPKDPRQMLAGLATIDKSRLTDIVMQAKANKEASSSSTRGAGSGDVASVSTNLISRPIVVRRKSRKKSSQDPANLQSSNGNGGPPMPQEQIPQHRSSASTSTTMSMETMSEAQGQSQGQTLRRSASGSGRGPRSLSRARSEVGDQGQDGSGEGKSLGERDGKGGAGGQAGSVGNEQEKTALAAGGPKPGNDNGSTNMATSSSSVPAEKFRGGQDNSPGNAGSASAAQKVRPPSSNGRPGTANSTASTMDSSKRSSKYSIIRTIEDNQVLDVDDSSDSPPPTFQRPISRFEAARQAQERKRASIIDTVDVDDVLAAASSSDDDDGALTEIPFVRARDILAHRRAGQPMQNGPPTVFLDRRQRPLSVASTTSIGTTNSSTAAASQIMERAASTKAAPHSPPRPQTRQLVVPASPPKRAAHPKLDGYIAPETEDRTPPGTELSVPMTRRGTNTTTATEASIGKPRRKAYESSAPVMGEGDSVGEGDSWLVKDLLPLEKFQGLFHRVKSEVQWETMYHRGGEVPRLVAVEADVGADSSFPLYRHPSDESPPVLPFSPTVARIRDYVQKSIGHPVNHVLIQLYRGGSDFISEHSDKTLDIVHGSSIVNVSLGAQRVMTLRQKKDSKEWEQKKLLGQEIERGSEPGDVPGIPRPAQKIPLPHNSMFVLGPSTNEKWMHAIRPDKRPESLKKPEELLNNQERISLTFRHIGTFLAPHFPKGALDRGTDGTYLIWGQGATAKHRAQAQAVVSGNSPTGEAMLHAFGSENHLSTFDWNQWYGKGFDVLHFRARAVPIARLAFYPADNPHVRILKQLLDALRVPIETFVRPPDPTAPGGSAGPAIRLTDLRSNPPAYLATDSVLAILHYFDRSGFPIFPTPSPSSTRTLALALDIIHDTLTRLSEIPLAKLPLCKGGFLERIEGLERKVGWWGEGDEEVGLVEACVWGLVEEMARQGVGKEELGDGKWAALRRCWESVGEEWGAEQSDLRV